MNVTFKTMRDTNDVRMTEYLSLGKSMQEPA